MKSSDVDWQSWSREAVALMQARNHVWQTQFDLHDADYRWDTSLALLTFETFQGRVLADLTVVGTLSRADGTFMWAWANDFPLSAIRDLARVREFGAANELPMLTEPSWPAGTAEALEALAIAGRILDAEGVFVDDLGDVCLYFSLSHFRVDAADRT